MAVKGILFLRQDARVLFDDGTRRNDTERKALRDGENTSTKLDNWTEGLNLARNKPNPTHEVEWVGGEGRSSSLPGSEENTQANGILEKSTKNDDTNKNTSHILQKVNISRANYPSEAKCHTQYKGKCTKYIMYACAQILRDRPFRYTILLWDDGVGELLGEVI